MTTTTAPAAEPLAKRQRHLNFTRRVRISPQWLTLALVRPDTGCTEVEFLWKSGCDDLEPTVFDEPCGIGPERFGPAEVFIEASRQTFWQRHSLGTAADLADLAKREEPVRVDFDEFDSLEGVRFRVKVTGRSAHDQSRLLAVAERLRVAGLPKEIEGRSLLPIASEPLGPRPYRIDFADGPLLVLNTRLGPKEQVAVEPAVVGLVLPAAVGQIAARLLAETRDMSDAELRVAADWRADWFGFLRDRLRIGRPGQDDADEQNEIDDDAWVETVVDAFCGRHDVTETLLNSDMWTASEGNDDD